MPMHRILRRPAAAALLIAAAALVPAGVRATAGESF